MNRADFPLRLRTSEALREIDPRPTSLDAQLTYSDKSESVYE